MCKPSAGEIVAEIPGALRIYKDGRIERLLRSPFVPASENPDAAGIATRDVVIDRGTGVAARLFLPAAASPRRPAGGRRLPFVVYFHGARSRRRAPSAGGTVPPLRHLPRRARRGARRVRGVPPRARAPLPAAYNDAWAALRGVASSSEPDPWLADRADPRRVFLAGDSAGGNIAFHTAVPAGREGTGGGGGMDVEGDVTLVESASEDHGFHLSGPPRASSIELLGHIVKFINKEVKGNNLVVVADTKSDQKLPVADKNETFVVAAGTHASS
ncbi:hypothetical protein C2845_PM03G08820 [Panicum miliaceum]|uniref:Alpha/beta hydrolase fold-3 domain-containing protein n=1 Tax=Panicum miliaceum TaxID=4540 RepID=A0A3L6TBU3_PANMI|nr:hypothetical protein C2845_PM03G08820 [Panicum miliaceum]